MAGLCSGLGAGGGGSWLQYTPPQLDWYFLYKNKIRFSPPPFPAPSLKKTIYFQWWWGGHPVGNNIIENGKYLSLLPIFKRSLGSLMFGNLSAIVEHSCVHISERSLWSYSGESK